MKIDEAPVNVRTESTFTDDGRKTLGISEEVLGHVTSMLSDFYADSEYAVARETISNGVDACIENGVTPQVDVTLSGPLVENPYVEFRDHGIGMSLDVFTNVFAEYGESTKRNSDRLTGAFGLGAKAFYAISDTATVITEHDGVKCVGIFSKDEQHRSDVNIKVLGETEQSGTTIKIPLKSQRSVRIMEDAIKGAAYAQSSGVVTLNGETLASHEDHIVLDMDDHGMILTKNSSMHSSSSRNVMALLGGIFYPLSNFAPLEIFSQYFYINSDHVLVLKFDLNSGLIPTPQRDQLKNTSNNVRLLAEKFEAVKTALVPTLEKKNSQAASLLEAAQILSEAKPWAHRFQIDFPEQFYREGEPVNSALSLDQDHVIVKQKAYRQRMRDISDQKYSPKYLKYTYFLEDISLDELQKTKVKKYINDLARTSGHVNLIFLPDGATSFGKEWLCVGGDESNVTVVARDEIMNPPTTENARVNRGGSPVEYKVFSFSEGDYNRSRMPAKETPDDVLYMEGWGVEHWDRFVGSLIFKIWADGKSFIVPSGTQKEYMIPKRAPHATNVREEFLTYLKEVAERELTQENLDTLNLRNLVPHVRNSHSAWTKVHDAMETKSIETRYMELWAQVIEAGESDALTPEFWDLNYFYRHVFDEAKEIGEKFDAVENSISFAGRYPLLACVPTWSLSDEQVLEHAIQYVMMVDNKEEETNG